MAVSHKNRIYLDVLTGIVGTSEEHSPSQILGQIDALLFCAKNPKRYVWIKHFHALTMKQKIKTTLNGDTFSYYHHDRKHIYKLSKEQMVLRMLFLLNPDDFKHEWLPKHKTNDNVYWRSIPTGTRQYQTFDGAVDLSFKNITQLIDFKTI